MDRTSLLTEEEIRIGPTRAAMRALGKNLRGHKSRVMKDIKAVVAMTHRCKRQNSDGQPLKLPFRNQEILVRRFSEVLAATARAIPEVEWHVDDKSVDDFERRRVVKSQKNVKRQASALAAAAARRAASGAAESFHNASRSAGWPQPQPFQQFGVRDAHDRSCFAHSPLCAADIEEWHRDHCPLCRSVEHSQYGFMGLSLIHI